MHENCEDCMYRFQHGAVSMCEYANLTHELRGCDPCDCKKLGKHKVGKRKVKNLNDVVVLWQYKTSLGRRY